MQEYWVNVYEGNLNSVNWNTQYLAMIASLHMKSADASSTLYRIHVKMKPKYDDSFAKDNAVLAKGFTLSTLIDDNSFKNRDLLRQAEDLFGVLDYH